MSAPAGQPVVSGSTISSATFNTLVGDLVGEISDSLSRSGKGGATAPIRTANGSVAAPSFSYTSEPGTGQYLAAAGDLRLAVTGVDALKLVSGALSLPNAIGPLTLSGGSTSIQVTLSNGFLLLQGNLNATNATNADTVLASTATRTAGYLASVQNPVGTNKLFIDYLGLLRLDPAAAAAAIQPASMVTAITPDTNIAASKGLGFFKDAVGVVHLMGTMTNNTGVGATNLVTATPLPAGFRPNVLRTFNGTTQSSATFAVTVSSGGAIAVASGTLANGAAVNLDGISFLAEV